MQTSNAQFIFISARQQMLHCFENDKPCKSYPISTGKNGLGERYGSECTPRGWHRIYSKIGLNAAVNSVFISRKWTGEIYSPELAAQHPGRDWILSRILQLDGLEEGRNKGGDVDSLRRCIYIHGTPDTTDLGKPGSRGCIRMRNSDLIELVNWVALDTKICIE
ncbi:L,D-transpeptidase [Tatlockia micdadei]|uniref:L,D-transpeptidase catalytic domain n=2 Tax=Legionella micdadei TaxID=451 RepID=A0A1G5DDU5_LEGMI|nr:L,D-transpeptidase [Legionella micdadei]KTD27747.1 putative ErfK/YbiS/YcfS/YnhG protein [Legionella micdadei]NSL17732.1 L,D-transpeptidase [Legionella micdadei]SCY12580.1 L,D-transpeptidase catalytic domain [Legionella micdadei]